MRETVRAYAEIYGDLGLFTALEISLRAIARGFESPSLRQKALLLQCFFHYIAFQKQNRLNLRIQTVFYMYS